MTKDAKDNMTRTAVAAAISTICASIILSIIFGFTDDNQKIKEDVQHIKINKVDRAEFEAKCKEIKEEAKQDKTEILTRLDALQSQNNQIYQILIEKK